MEQLKVAICGLGGLGRLHANSLAAMDDVDMVAVCDINPAKLQPQEIKFNIDSGAKTAFDISRCRTYTDLGAMLRKEDIEVLITALPTDLHAELAIKALRGGCHVFSEKPMALTVRECDQIRRVAEQTGKQFMTGQCLRFWPEYEALLAATKDGRYGKLKSLTLSRVSGYCLWSDWFNDGSRSGGGILDMHLHDVDWVYHAFGPPASLWASGLRGDTGEYDDVTALWAYPDFHVTLRGSLMYHGFRMSFQAFFEDAAMDFGMHPDPALRVLRAGATAGEKIPVSDESAYRRELRYFFDGVRGVGENRICTSASTRNSVQMVYKEREAIAKGKRVAKFDLV